ncbi:hypothetical protein [Kitasatospora sp. MBT63]|uniref:hypothetical protein n=1 Tax=Kitasatospora sp. MBT63 TaxID=1444768 RepID=UPI0011EA6D3F|nr:hypothetical protein [Kitasatospora sp. MBT63]
MTSTWRRLTDRLTGRTEPEPLWTEGIPDHLDVPVRDWLYEVLKNFGLAYPVAVRLKLPSDVLKADNPDWAIAVLNHRTHSMLRLEIVDATLACMAQALEGVPLHHRRTAEHFARVLDGILREGDSAFVVSLDGRGLERRIVPAVSTSVDAAITSAKQPERGSAAKHLRTAMDAAYALHPDPVRAYSEAIKAVESAAHVTLQPKHATATLGTMLGEFRQVRDKVSVPIVGPGGTEGIDAIERLMALLWTGQTSRHGNLKVTREETAQEALMAVHLAALLVQLFASGAVQRSR